MDIERGFRDKLEKYVNINDEVSVSMEVSGGAIYDFCCFGVDANDQLSDDRYMVFYNQTSSPRNEISYSAGRNSASFVLRLAQLPQSINKLVFTVSIDGNGTMGNINSHTVSIQQHGQSALRLVLHGSDFSNERAIIAIEIYRKQVWRIAAVARGFNGGLGDLLRAYGGEEVMSDNQPPQPQPQPRPRVQMNLPPRETKPPEPPVKRVILEKGQKVNLRKSGSSMGEILINLNWKQPEQTSFFGSLFGSKGIDLDLGCLFELTDGRKGCVQALGNTFGSLQSPPYIALDGDDRTGNVAGGENLRVNGTRIREIRRILVYTFIYEGAADWEGTQGVVTVKCPGSPDIIVKMDEYGSSQVMCAIAMLENCNNETFSVEKIVRFFNGHREMDKAFHWGLHWVSGHK